MSSPDSRLAERVIVVTGAASGFGRALMTRAAERGASVVGADINAAALAELVASLGERGLAVDGRPADVCEAADMRALCAFTVERFGRVDVMVNNAGVMPLAFFSDHAAATAAWSKAIDINLKGVVNGIAAVYDQMIAQGRGHVVNVSSTYGNGATEGSGVYSATKSAVNMISESLRMEAQGKIKVSVVRPAGAPTTGLAQSIVDVRASIGMVGHHAADARAKMKQLMTGALPPEFSDIEQIGLFALEPGIVADAILYVIDQPWGVSISDITVRAAGEPYLL